MKEALTPEWILIAGGVVSLLTVVGGFVRMTWWLSVQFSEQRKVMYRLHAENNRRVTRLEYWAVMQRNGFQPGTDLVSMGLNGNKHSEESTG